MYSSTFVYIYLRVPDELQREIRSFVPTRRQSFMHLMEAWVNRCYPNDQFVNVTEDESWKATNDPRWLGLSVTNDPEHPHRVHRFRGLPLREHIVWRKSSDDVLLCTDHHVIDDYMNRNTFYVATYRKMQSAIRTFNTGATEGTRGSWLTYEPIRWNDLGILKFVDAWYGTGYYVCWRNILFRHILHQMV